MLAANSGFTATGSGPESQPLLQYFTKFQLGFMHPPDAPLSAYNCHWQPTSGAYANDVVSAQISVYQLSRRLSAKDGLSLVDNGGGPLSNFPPVAGLGDWAYVDDPNSYSGVVFGKGNLLVLVEGDPNHTDQQTAAAAKVVAARLP